MTTYAMELLPLFCNWYEVDAFSFFFSKVYTIRKILDLLHWPITATQICCLAKKYLNRLLLVQINHVTLLLPLYVS